MDDLALKQYLADSPPTVVNLAIKPHFEALNDREKKYAHYISRAAFSGTRINLRQVSRESEAIYDFILTLHKSCNGMYTTSTTAAWVSAMSAVLIPSRRLEEAWLLCRCI